MIKISKIYKESPKEYKGIQEIVYTTLNKLSIKYKRVDTTEAISMEDCKVIADKLNMKMVKTLFVCNGQKTKFYLFITTEDKRFNTKNFSKVLNIPRTSFTSEEQMINILKTKKGSATIFSALIDIENKVQIVIDKDILKEEYYGCSDGTTTGYMKIKTKDILEKILPYSNHKEIIIEI